MWKAFTTANCAGFIAFIRDHLCLCKVACSKCHSLPILDFKVTKLTCINLKISSHLLTLAHLVKLLESSFKKQSIHQRFFFYSLHSFSFLKPGVTWYYPLCSAVWLYFICRTSLLKAASMPAATNKTLTYYCLIKLYWQPADMEQNFIHLESSFWQTDKCSQLVANFVLSARHLA